MPASPLTELNRPVPPKRTFADLCELSPCSAEVGAAKRLRIEASDAEQEVKVW